MNNQELFNAVKNDDYDFYAAKIKDNVKLKNFRDEYDRALIHYAIMYDSKEIFNDLLKMDCDINARDKNGMTPIHMAAYFNRSKMAKDLVEKGAKIGVIDNNFQTPLHHAVDGESREVIYFLVEKGASYHTIDNKGYNPIHLAFEEGYEDIGNYFCKTYAERIRNFKKMTEEQNELDFDNPRPNKMPKITYCQSVVGNFTQRQ